MKIRNTGRYALSFNIKVNGRDKKIEFDKQRFYLDTGNLATSGITEVSDDEYTELKKCKEFSVLFENQTFEEVSEEEYIAGSGNAELQAKESEIKQLKEQLKEKEEKLKEKSEADVEKKLSEKDSEIKNLKAQLELLSKTRKGKKGAEEL